MELHKKFLMQNIYFNLWLFICLSYYQPPPPHSLIQSHYGYLGFFLTWNTIIWLCTTLFICKISMYVFYAFILFLFLLNNCFFYNTHFLYIFCPSIFPPVNFLNYCQYICLSLYRNWIKYKVWFVNKTAV